VLAARDLLRAPEGGATAIVSRFAKLHGDPFERVKSTNRLRNVLAREEAFARGAFEALLPTEEGDLSEGTQSNLFVLSGGRLATPSVERGCLAGIVRELVLGDLEREPLAVPLAVGRVTPGDVERADEAFLTNTTGWVVPLVAVLGLRSGLPGGAGPVVREVRARIARLSARHRAERGRRTAAR
jgi:branched-subunit amino acid aminotransferase/4-amino-4-deoxychorismate lyase